MMVKKREMIEATSLPYDATPIFTSAFNFISQRAFRSDTLNSSILFS